MDLPCELGQYRSHLRTPVNMCLHRKTNHVSDPDQLRVVLGPFHSADEAQLTASAPDLAVDHRRRLSHTTIITPARRAEDHHDRRQEL
jgi:hypothetical protein